MKLRITEGVFIWDDNPALQRREGLCVPAKGRKNSQLDELIRFVYFFCDSTDSPLALETDFEYRRLRACQLSKFRDVHVKRTCELFGEEETDMSQWLRDVMCDYFKMMNSSMFEAWFSLKINFFQQSKLIRMPLAADKEGNYEKSAESRNKISSVLPELTRQIMEIEAILFSGVKEISDAINEAAIEGSLAGYVELKADTLDEDMERLGTKV